MKKKPTIDLPTEYRSTQAQSHKEAVDLFSNPITLSEILKKVGKILGCEIDQEKTHTLIDPKSINGKGGHLVISTISGDGGDGEQSGDKKYHLKLVLKNDGVSLEHQFAEIAYYLMYQNFGYGPKTAVVIQDDSLILLLEDANNPLPDRSSAKFSDWKKIKDSTSRREIEEKLTSSKADLYALEILTLITATGDIFQKPDNYGVKIIGSDAKTRAIPFVVDLLPPPHGANDTFFGRIGAYKYCGNFKDSKQYAILIADLLLKSFDLENDQREVSAIKDFHIFDYFRDGNRGKNIDDLKRGLKIILSNEFGEKIINAFNDSLKYLDDYFSVSQTKISEDCKNQARKIIEERRDFILSVGQELREYSEIKDVISNEWFRGKYEQTRGRVAIADRELPEGAGVKFFPSPGQVARIRRPTTQSDSALPPITPPDTALLPTTQSDSALPPITPPDTALLPILAEPFQLGKRLSSALTSGVISTAGDQEARSTESVLQPTFGSALKSKEKLTHLPN